ncbi:hypothetical protein [Microbacterium sp. A93]|uniref:hypothetical protein n=1 Tax=Microbacterium sp. A93 TaxID=3450716 RepID=UPI003F422B0B
MSAAAKSAFRELRQAVLNGFGHAKDKLPQLADNMNDHLDTVIKRVRDKDNYDGKPDTPNSTNPHRPGDGNNGGGNNGNGNPGGGNNVDGNNGGGNPGSGRNDGRDERGRFVGDGNRPWVDREKIGLDNVADDLGVDIIRDQVASRHPSTGEQVRFFDGLFENPDGTYTGVEIKSGSAGRSPAQNLFDGAVSVETPAIAHLPDVGQIDIIKVILRNVP